MTPVRLAERLGQARSSVSKRERGERCLDLVKARAFCVAMGISFAGFVAAIDAVVAGPW